MFMPYFSSQSVAMRAAIDQALGAVAGKLAGAPLLRANLHFGAIEHVYPEIRTSMLDRFEGIPELHDDECDALATECVAAVAACYRACTIGTVHRMPRVGVA